MTVRVSREAYFEAALDVLAESGFKGLSIARLTDMLDVTKGSFYHHFGSLSGFIDALLGYWGDRQRVVLRDLNFGAGDRVRDIEALRTVAAGLNHEAEAAFRAWAMNNEAVGAAVRRVDSERRRTVNAAVASVVPDGERANTLTDLGMSMLVGFQLLTPSDHALIEKLLDEFAALVLLNRSKVSARA